MTRYFLVLFSFVFLVLPEKAFAEASLFFAPTRLEITEDKPVQEIRVTNMSSIARSYRISMENLVMSEKGMLSRVDNFDYSAKRIMRYVPRKFDLQPGERQIIRVMARYPKDVMDGDYHAHIEFLENVGRRSEINDIAEDDMAGRARMMAQISYATAVPIVISKGKISAELELSSIAVGKNKNEKPEVSLVINRSGNGQGKALIEVDYFLADGSVKKAASRRYIPVYREIEKREHSFILELMEPSEIVSGARFEVKLFDQRVSENEPIKRYEISVP